MGRRTKARECAIQMLYQWDLTRAPIGSVIDGYWAIRTTVDATRALAERLVRGAYAAVAELDQTIGAAIVNWRFDRLAAVDRSILRIAAYELLFELQTPAAVILDEAVEIAKRFGDKESPAFVNGVLDAVRRRVRGTGDAPEGKA